MSKSILARTALRPIKKMVDRLRTKIITSRHSISIGNGVKLIGQPIISTTRNSHITIGHRAVLISQSRHTALGVNHPVILRTLARGASIKIGNDVGLSGTTICAAILIEIGAGTLIGANVTVADTDFHPIVHEARRYAAMPQPVASDAVQIGRNVFIGTGVIILKGTSIGADCVVGAGSVVKGNFEAGSIIAGNPARVVKPFRSG